MNAALDVKNSFPPGKRSGRRHQFLILSRNVIMSRSRLSSMTCSMSSETMPDTLFTRSFPWLAIS
jgi:hypothetical protein